MEDSHYFIGSISACVLLLAAHTRQVVLSLLDSLQRLHLKRFHSDEKLRVSLMN